MIGQICNNIESVLLILENNISQMANTVFAKIQMIHTVQTDILFAGHRCVDEKQEVITTMQGENKLIVWEFTTGSFQVS